MVQSYSQKKWYKHQDMDSKDSSYRSGHRIRLREKFLAGKLVDYELLELLLTYALPRIDVKPIARSLLKKYGGIHQVLNAPIESLVTNQGIKENSAVLIKLIHEMMLVDYRNHMADAPIFHDYKRVSDYSLQLLSGKSVEEFHVLYLGPNYKLLSDDLHSSGTLDWAAVYPREILKRALGLNARSVILMHNHPTPGTAFSTPDIEITADIKKILATVDIELFDHILVTGGIVHSAKNMFLVK